MHCEEKLKLKSYNTRYCSIEVVTKAGWNVYGWYFFNITKQVDDFSILIADIPFLSTKFTIQLNCNIIYS